MNRIKNIKKLFQGKNNPKIWQELCILGDVGKISTDMFAGALSHYVELDKTTMIAGAKCFKDFTYKLKADFYLYKYKDRSFSMELEQNGMSSFSIDTLAEQTKELLRTNGIRFFTKYSETSNSVYVITYKWLKIRISDHPACSNNKEDLNVYYMGLHRKSDGLLQDFECWLERYMFERKY